MFRNTRWTQLWKISSGNSTVLCSASSSLFCLSISFVSSYSSWDDVEQIVHNIPYKRIFIIGGTVFTIYGYIKFIVTVYNYLKSKFYTRINNSSSIHNSALFLIESLKKTNSIKTIDRIYLAALQLQYFISNFPICR